MNMLPSITKGGLWVWLNEGPWNEIKPYLMLKIEVGLGLIIWILKIKNFLVRFIRCIEHGQGDGAVGHFVDGTRRPQAKECGQPLDPEKYKEIKI